MNVQLAAWGTLLQANLMTWNEYVENLHALFLENPDSDLLLKLEMSTSKKKDTYAILHQSAAKLTENEKRDYARTILCPLETLYRLNMPLADFNAIGRRVYTAIPAELSGEEPFGALTTADDYLDIDVNFEKTYDDRARDLFEYAFACCNPDCLPFIRPPKPKREHFLRRLFKRRIT